MGNRNVPVVRFAGYVSYWACKKLGEGTLKISDGIHGTPKYTINGTIPFINGNNLVDGKIIITNQTKYVNEDQLSLKDKELNLNTILMSINGTIGNLAYYSNELVMLGKSVSFIEVLKFDKKFTYQLLQTRKIKNYFYNNLTGTTIKNLGLRTIKETPTFVPERSEQIKIGEMFEKLDDTIIFNQQELTTLKQTKQGFLQKMFPKEGETVPEVRFPGFGGEWQERCLGQISTFINGRAFKQHELLEAGKYKVLRVGNFYTNNSWYFSDLELDDKFYAKKGDLLYTWSASFGPHIWLGDKVIYHYHIWKVELSNKIVKQFMVQLLEYDKAKITSDKNGSTMVHITKKGMEEKIILLPEVDEQTQIGNFFKQLDEAIALQEQELEALQQTKQAFLQKMFV